MAYDFESGNDRVAYTTPASVNNISQVSVAGWLYPDATDNFQRWILKGDNFPNDYFSIEWDSNSLRFVVRTNSTAGSWGISNSDLPTGQWSHYLLTHDGSTLTNVPVVYINGSTVTVTTHSTPTGIRNSDTTNLTIGNQVGGEGGFNEGWDGRIAEVAIWDRILSASEASILADKFSPAFLKRNLQFYAPLIRGSNDIKGLVGTATDTSILAHPAIIYPNSYKKTYGFTTAAPAAPADNAIFFGANF